MVLALMRLWDTPRHTFRLEHIASTLRDRQVIEALAVDRAPFPEALDQMRQDLARRAMRDTNEHYVYSIALLDPP